MKPGRSHLLSPLLLALAASAQAQTAGPQTLGLGGRMAWTQSPLSNPDTWIDAQAVYRPLPRLFLAGGWGMADETRGDTAVSELRWDLTLGVVVLQGDATGYIPFLWRHVTEDHSWYGDAHWTEIGTGVGALVPMKDWLQLRTEILWSVPTNRHDDPRLGPGQQVDGGHLELSLGFLAFVI